MTDLTVVLALLAAAILMFAANKPRMDAVALLMLTLLPFTGVVSMGEALAGFADANVVLLATLFVIGESLVRTGVAQRIGDRLMKGAGSSDTRLLVLLMLAVGVLGAVMSSTGVVAIFIPIALRIARATGTPASRLMMPLSVAAAVERHDHPGRDRAEPGRQQRAGEAGLGGIRLLQLHPDRRVGAAAQHPLHAVRPALAPGDGGRRRLGRGAPEPAGLDRQLRSRGAGVPPAREAVLALRRAHPRRARPARHARRQRAGRRAHRGQSGRHLRALGPARAGSRRRPAGRPGAPGRRRRGAAAEGGPRGHAADGRVLRGPLAGHGHRRGHGGHRLAARRPVRARGPRPQRAPPDRARPASRPKGGASRPPGRAAARRRHAAAGRPLEGDRDAAPQHARAGAARPAGRPGAGAARAEAGAARGRRAGPGRGADGDGRRPERPGGPRRRAC